MPSPTRDLSSFPLVFEYFPAGYSDAELERYLQAGLDERRLIGRPWVSVVEVDLSLRMIGPAQMKIWTRYAQASTEMWQQVAGTAVVAATPLIRGMANLVIERSKNPAPIQLFERRELAIRWAVFQLEARVGEADRPAYAHHLEFGPRP